MFGDLLGIEKWLYFYIYKILQKQHTQSEGELLNLFFCKG